MDPHPALEPEEDEGEQEDGAGLEGIKGPSFTFFMKRTDDR